MPRLELLKQKVAEACGNEANHRNIYETDFCKFIIGKQGIYLLYDDDYEDLNYFVPEFTEEEFKEVKRIESELRLNWDIYLPIEGSVALDLESLIEYYYDDDDAEAKTKEISRLIEELDREDSVFYNREYKFLDIFLHGKLKSGIAYVHSEWDHDDAYYLGLPFSTGIYDTLYEIIADNASLTLPEDLKCFEDDECDYWIDVLSNLDKYLILENQ